VVLELQSNFADTFLRLVHCEEDVDALFHEYFGEICTQEQEIPNHKLLVLATPSPERKESKPERMISCSIMKVTSLRKHRRQKGRQFKIISTHLTQV